MEVGTEVGKIEGVEAGTLVGRVVGTEVGKLEGVEVGTSVG